MFFKLGSKLFLRRILETSIHFCAFQRDMFWPNIDLNRIATLISPLLQIERIRIVRSLQGK